MPITVISYSVPSDERENRARAQILVMLGDHSVTHSLTSFISQKKVMSRVERQWSTVNRIDVDVDADADATPPIGRVDRDKRQHSPNKNCHCRLRRARASLQLNANCLNSKINAGAPLSIKA